MIKPRFALSLVFVAFVFCLANFRPVAAIESGDVVMRVSPVEQEIELEPGAHASSVVNVQNAGRLPFTISLSATPYQVTNEAYDPDFASENSYTKLHNWISFPEKTYTIEPGAMVAVPFEIDVPEDIPGGGQYAAIMVETRDMIDDSAVVKTVGRVASLLYAHVSGEEHIGGVLMGHTMPGLMFSPEFSASATVKNDGNVDFRVDHQLTIHDFFTGRAVLTPETVNSEDQTPGHANPVVLPGTARTNVLTWDGAPKLGAFRVTQRIAFLDEVYEFHQIVVFCPIWLILLVVLFLVTMILWLIVRVAKGRRERPQVL